MEQKEEGTEKKTRKQNWVTLVIQKRSCLWLAGRLPLSMTSPAYGQEATEESHTALMRNRLLQQMQTAGSGDLLQQQHHHRGSHSRDTAEVKVLAHDGSCWQQRFGEGCLQHPLRGSGHHHYLPSPGDNCRQQPPL